MLKVFTVHIYVIKLMKAAALLLNKVDVSVGGYSGTSLSRHQRENVKLSFS